MNITDNNITYALPFDGIDLNYITTKTKFLNDEVPLWNGSKNSSREYYKVEITAHKKLESGDHKTESGNGLNDPMFHCQVCNISIPLGYKKQHKLSPKHKTCLKILEAAIDRTKNLIQATDEDTVRPAPDSYFCEACAVAVKTLKWEEHELSKEHFKSLQHDRFLNDLLLIYVDKGHLDNVDFEYMTITNKNCDEKKSESNSNVDSEAANDDVTEELDDFMNLMEYNENVDKDEEILKANEETGIIDEKYKNAVISFKDYIEMLTNNSHSSLSPKLAMKCDKLELATSDKSVIYLSEDNFHGFSKKNYSNRILCKLCDSVFIDENEHKMLPEHMKKVMTPIPDMHGIRQGNQYKHCVLCNESIYNFEEHKTSEAHINILRNALSHNNFVKINEQSPTAAEKPSRTYCSPCNEYIDTQNFAGHTKGKKHKENVASFYGYSSSTDTDTPIPSPYVSTDTAKKTFCAPSNMYLSTNNLSSHLNGQRHKSNMSQYESHQNKSHMTKLFTLLTNIDPYVNSKIGKLCRICNVTVTPSEKNLKQHCKGNNHTINIENLLSKYNIERLNNKLVCGKCKQQFDFKSYLDHIETHEGKKVPSKLRLCRLCNIRFPDTYKALDVHKNSVKHTNNLEELHHPHLEVVNYDYDDYDVKCSVCDFDIDFLEAKAHVKSQRHLQEFNRLVLENKVLIREGLYICTLCSIVINDESQFLDHVILNPIHKERIDYDHKYIECIFCNVEVPYSQKSIAQHENGKFHRESYNDIVERLDFENSSRNEVVHISNQSYVIHI